MAIKKDVLDELLAGADGKDVSGKNGLFDELKKALAERMLNVNWSLFNSPTPSQSCDGGRDRSRRHGHATRTDRPSLFESDFEKF